LWVKLFAAGIGLILAFSLYKIPRNIKTGIQFEKGMTAMSQKKYLTAQNEFQKVVNKAPAYIEAQGNLMISSFYNMDFETFAKTFEVLKGEDIKDAYLLGQLENILKKAEGYYSNDEIKKLEHDYGDNFEKIPDNILRKFLDSNNNNYAAMGYASRLFDKDSFAACDSIVKLVLKDDPEFIPGYMTLASSKRQQGQFEESIGYCDKVLSINSEYAEAISSKSRTLLKAGKDKDALELALKSFHLNEKDSYAIASLILVYHFTNKTDEKNKMISRIKPLTDSISVQSLRYAMDVIEGREFFRK
jgi:tetratricopeptide (TPR) repeat protein